MLFWAWIQYNLAWHESLPICACAHWLFCLQADHHRHIDRKYGQCVLYSACGPAYAVLNLPSHNEFYRFSQTLPQISYGKGQWKMICKVKLLLEIWVTMFLRDYYKRWLVSVRMRLFTDGYVPTDLKGNGCACKGDHSNKMFFLAIWQ